MAHSQWSRRQPGYAHRGAALVAKMRSRERSMRGILALGLTSVMLAGSVAATDAATAVRKPKSRADETRRAHGERAPKGPLLIVVSIADQRVSLFGDGALVARGAVSTGMRGHPTPEGIFSVIQKDRYHQSNIYSGAPMPYMQRITWSGVALHAGVLPGYPASHGCIRLTYEFATMLWHTTRLGVRVIVARNAIEPVEIVHPALFVPKPAEAPVAASRPTAMVTSGGVRIAEGADAPTATDAVARPSPDAPKDAESPRPAGASKEVEAPRAADAPAPMQPDAPQDAQAPRPADAAKDAEMAKPSDAPKAAEVPRIVDPAQVIALAKAEFGTLPITAEPTRKREQVSVVVSRREGRLFVRQNFMPLFSMPVTIRRPNEPLGTHVFTAMEEKDRSGSMRWTVVSIPGRSIGRTGDQEPARGKSHRRAEEERKKPEHEPVARTAAAALDRIDMPKDAVDRIDGMVSSGFSFIVSDDPISDETEEGTDFIVLTR